MTEGYCKKCEALRAEVDALRQQLKHVETERDAMRQTYDKTVERLEREITRLNNLPLVREIEERYRQIDELQAQIRRLKGPANTEGMPQD